MKRIPRLILITILIAYGLFIGLRPVEANPRTAHIVWRTVGELVAIVGLDLAKGEKAVRCALAKTKYETQIDAQGQTRVGMSPMAYRSFKLELERKGCLEREACEKMPTYLTLRQAARRTGVTEATVAEWVQSGKLSGYKIGREWRIGKAGMRQLGLCK